MILSLVGSDYIGGLFSGIYDSLIIIKLVKYLKQKNQIPLVCKSSSFELEKEMDSYIRIM